MRIIDIDKFFHSCPKVEDASLAKITDFVTQPQDIQLTVQYDPIIAASFRENIIREWKSEKK